MAEVARNQSETAWEDVIERWWEATKDAGWWGDVGQVERRSCLDKLTEPPFTAPMLENLAATLPEIWEAASECELSLATAACLHNLVDLWEELQIHRLFGGIIETLLFAAVEAGFIDEMPTLNRPVR